MDIPFVFEVGIEGAFSDACLFGYFGDGGVGYSLCCEQIEGAVHEGVFFLSLVFFCFAHKQHFVPFVYCSPL